jgi:hypothetical protein
VKNVVQLQIHDYSKLHKRSGLTGNAEVLLRRF